jgi:predicted MPP superfamily phosphohydrolase
MTDKVNILHLSDIHFGAEPNLKVNSTSIAQRENALKGLIELLRRLDLEWQPNIVVISGDIGWKGAKDDYQRAKMWLETLLRVLGLTPKELVVCAGNHDLDRRKTVGMKPPILAEEADEWLKIESLENFVRPFESYTSFCSELNIPPLYIGSEPSHLVGQRKIAGLRFVVLNSAWFSRGDEDRGKLWIGLPQLEVMENSSQLVKTDNYDTDAITVAVIHHPNSWLSDAEQNSYADRLNTYRYLSQHCHIILSGHVHGAVENPHRIHGYATLFTGGATYAGNSYRNNFSLLQIDVDKRTVLRRAFEYDPRYSRWVDFEKALYPLRASTNDETQIDSGEGDPESITELADTELIKWSDIILNYAYFFDRDGRRSFFGIDMATDWINAYGQFIAGVELTSKDLLISNLPMKFDSITGLHELDDDAISLAIDYLVMKGYLTRTKHVAFRERYEITDKGRFYFAHKFLKSNR